MTIWIHTLINSNTLKEYMYCLYTLYFCFPIVIIKFFDKFDLIIMFYIMFWIIFFIVLTKRIVKLVKNEKITTKSVIGFCLLLMIQVLYYFQIYINSYNNTYTLIFGVIIPIAAVYLYGKQPKNQQKPRTNGRTN